MYDIAIIGAGAAGIRCAQKALHEGLKVVVFDQSPDTFGGICLNRGCIPTKFLIQKSKISKNWKEALVQSREIVKKIKNPLLSHLETQGVQFVWARPRLIDKNNIQVDNHRFDAHNIVIATGSVGQRIFDHPKAFVAEELLVKPDLADNILIVGAGYIGIELASLLSDYGKKVTLVEKEDNILSSYEPSLSNRLRVILEKKGIVIETSKSITNEDLDDFDLVLLATGRCPATENLGLEKIGIKLDERGWIKTDSSMRTNINNIYACGDVTGKKLLAYTAEYQAHLCVRNITGKNETEDYYALPECVFSSPQIAKVGITKEEARQKNIKHSVLRSNFLKFSSSCVYDDEQGFMEVLVGEDDKIIGAAIISVQAAELINILSLCIKNNLTLKDLQKCLFTHPTLSEVIPLFSRSFFE